MRSIRDAGYERFNIDLMYGFLHQTDVDFKNTLKYAIGLNPEYITLYITDIKELSWNPRQVAFQFTRHSTNIGLRTVC